MQHNLPGGSTRRQASSVMTRYLGRHLVISTSSLTSKSYLRVASIILVICSNYACTKQYKIVKRLFSFQLMDSLLLNFLCLLVADLLSFCCNLLFAAASVWIVLLLAHQHVIGYSGTVFCDRPWTLTFWSQNKWISRTLRGTYPCHVSWS